MKRLIVAGFFGGEVNQVKRRLWLEADAAKLYFDEIWLLSPEKPREIVESAFAYARFPLWLSACPFHPVWFFKGIIRIAALLLGDYRFLRELLALEWKAISIDQKLIALKEIEFSFKCAKAISGLGKTYDTLSSLKINRNDCIVIWSEHMTGMRILKKMARESKAKLLFCEYGELPTTVFACHLGMFHESWPVVYKQRFRELPISNDDMKQVHRFLQDIARSRVSSKVGQYSDDLGHVLSNLPQNKPIVYVNGSQQHASGLLPRDTLFSKEFSPFFSSNEEILLYFSELGARHGWTIIYKDHPNNHSYFPKQCLPTKGWGAHVIVLNNVDIYDVFSVADVTVTLGSKTAFLSLLCNVPVMLLGPYSFDQDDLPKYVRCGSDFGLEINQLLASNLDDQAYWNQLCPFLTRYMKYFLYSLCADQEALFGRGMQCLWHDLISYFQNERDVIGTDLKLSISSKIENLK